MPVVEVSCPTCGTRFKAPDSAIGKKAKCKKCGNGFRVTGGPSAGVPLPDGPVVAMAESVDDVLSTPAPLPTPPLAAPVKDISSLPSADPFDFGSAPAKSSPTPAPIAKPNFGSAKPAAPATLPPPVAPRAPAAPPPPEPLPLEPLTASEDPFAFSESPAPPVKNRGDAPDEPSSRKRREEVTEKPRSDKKGQDEEERPDRKSRKRDTQDERTDAADAPYNPFANYDAGPGEVVTARNPWDDEKPKKKRKTDDGEEDEPEPEKPRYLRPEEKGGMGKTIMATGAIALIALLLGATAIVVFIKQNRKEPEQVKEEKKEEPPPQGPDTPAVPPGAPAGEPKGKEPETKPKEKGKEPDPKPKGKEPAMLPGMTRPAVSFARPHAIRLGALPAKLEEVDKPSAGLVLESPVNRIKHIFPPSDTKSGDTAILIQTNPGAGGMGEKLALDIYGPAGNRIAADRIDYDGDGLVVPIADFMVTKEQKAYFLAATGGKLHVWSVAEKKKLADGISPYATKPEHAKAGLAAAFFTADPNRVILVSSAGAVLLYDLKSNKPVKDFIPPNGAIGRVSQGHSAAKVEGGASVVVVVGGVLYQIQADDKLAVLQTHDLGGDVFRSLGIAVIGVPGRIVYTFEGLVDGKREKLALGFPTGSEAKPVVYRLPTDAVGEPRGALWAGSAFAGVTTDRGVIWFDDDGKKFLPMLFTQPTDGSGFYYGDEKYFWYVIAHPKEANKSVLAALAMPLEGFENYTKKFVASQPIPAARIDAKGLAK